MQFKRSIDNCKFANTTFPSNHTRNTQAMESSIIRRLETVEEEIFSAVASDGSSALATFTEKWTALQQDVNQALQAGHLSRKTQVLVFQTASIVSTLAESFKELQKGYSSLSVQFKDAMENIYSQVRCSCIYPLVQSAILILL